jgi:asparagine synthase (glutamine-hydrolysing)
MCGLAGVLSSPTGPGASVDELSAIGSAMVAALTHRGPDDSGVWTDEDAGVSLAHRRLAIIDLSDQGRQPMVSRDGRYVLVFNGEIYNHPELSQRLTTAGVRLRGHSDTEVLLETIASSSLLDALDEVNGMFALALWDRRDRTLTLARDRLGEKPMYYGVIGGQFVFASELSALRRHPHFDKAVEPGAVALLVRHSYIPGPHTVYRGVHKLPPGNTLEIRADRGPDEAAPRPFWSLKEVAESGQRRVRSTSEEDLLEEVQSLLEDSVRLRMVSDVPLGAFLSGGIDSSLVVALMQRVATRPVRTFTVSVGGRHDEAGHAAAVARRLGTEHTQIDLAESDALDLVTRLPLIYDEPFGDPSAIPTSLMCAAARQHVTVCLSGDGGDEVMAGYNRYRAAGGGFDRLGRIPAPLRSAAARRLLAVPPERWDRLSGRLPARLRIPDVGTKVHKLATLLPAASAYDRYRALVTNMEPASVLLDGAEPVTVGSERWDLPVGLDGLHLMQYLDTSTVLPDDMLVKVDRASMASSLECRVPLLDHRFVELAWELPLGAKVRDNKGKWLLRQILARHVPSELFERPKQGFDPPLAAWLRGPLRPLVSDLLSGDRLRRQGIFQPAVVQQLLDAHQSARRNHDYALWTLLSFQLWLDHAQGGR